ncbi:MAG: hypothetical protein R3F34_19060 [Planctomycetota bacterium]
MTTRTSNGARSAELAATPDTGRTYSKDYWDLVLEQLGKHTLFKVGMFVLAILYGLAIFAPLIGNDRPYVLVAVDRGAYDAALRGASSIAASAVRKLAAAESGSESGSLAEAERELQAVSTRFDVMRLHLSSADGEDLDALEQDLRAARERVGRGQDLGDEQVEDLAGRVGELATQFAPLAADAPDDAVGKRLVPHTSYPILKSIGWGSIFFMVLWLVGATFPLWNRLWNRRILRGDRSAIRRARTAKWGVLAGVPLVAMIGWILFVGGGDAAFDVAPYKEGLTDGTIVPSEPPRFAPLPYGYAELHEEEMFRPPTWWKYAQLDSDGRYIHGLRRPKADLVTGYLPPPVPTIVRFAEPWPNSPVRHLAGTDEQDATSSSACCGAVASAWPSGSSPPLCSPSSAS